MPPPTPSPSIRYLVHHQGQIQGPFDINFIEAMVMSGVYPDSVMLENADTAERFPFSSLLPAPGPVIQKKRKSARRRSGSDIWPIAGGIAILLAICWIAISTSLNKPGKLASATTQSSPTPKATWAPGATTTRPAPPAKSRPQYTASETGIASDPLPPSPTVGGGLYNPPPRLPAPSKPTSYLPASSSSTTRASDTTPYGKTSPDDDLIYEDASGRRYTVSNADYQRLSNMKLGIDRKHKKVAEDKSVLDEQMLKLDAERLRLDDTSQSAVDSYNRKVDAVERLRLQVNSRVDDFNRDVNSFNAELERVGTPTY